MITWEVYPYFVYVGYYVYLLPLVFVKAFTPSEYVKVDEASTLVGAAVWSVYQPTGNPDGLS